MTKADHGHSMNVDKSSEEGDRKRNCLRSAEADLKVIVGDEKEAFKVYWCYSQVLATQSRYVDTLLSTPLPTNNDKNPSKDHKEITFPDITPSQWERMTRFLTNPTSMTVEDAMELAPIFDKYEFPTGIKFCDDVLCKKVILRADGIGFRVACRNKLPDPRAIDRCVDVIVLSHINNLPKTFHWGREWLGYAIDRYRNPLQYFPLTAIHIRRLVPALIRDSELLKLRCRDDIEEELDINYEDYDQNFDEEIFGSFPPETFPLISDYLDDGGDEVGIDLEYCIEPRFPFGDYDIENPMLADFFLAALEIQYLHITADPDIYHINVIFPSGDHELAGYYRATNPTHLHYIRRPSDPRNIRLYKCPRTRQWQLERNNRILFVCQYPQFSRVPPETGWSKSSDNDQELDEVPVIEYLPPPAQLDETSP